MSTFTILTTVEVIGQHDITPNNEKVWSRHRLSDKQMSKTYDYSGDKRSATNYAKAFAFTSYERSFVNIEELAHELSTLSTRNASVVIRGQRRWPSDVAVTRTSRDVSGRTAPSFIDVDRDWICIDIDDIYAPEGWQWDNPWAMAYDLLPPQIAAQRPQGVWQYSSSSRLPPELGAEPSNKIKAHVWFLLERPACNASIKTWLVSEQTDDLCWDRALFSAVQVHYTAAPTIIGLSDPHENRIIPNLVGPARLDASAWLMNSEEMKAQIEADKAIMATELANMVIERPLAPGVPRSSDGGGYQHLLETVFDEGLEAELVEEALRTCHYGDMNYWLGVGGLVKEALSGDGFDLWATWGLGNPNDSSANQRDWQVRWDVLPTSNGAIEALGRLCGSNMGNVNIKSWLQDRGVAFGASSAVQEETRLAAAQRVGGETLSATAEGFMQATPWALRGLASNRELAAAHDWYVTMPSTSFQVGQVAHAVIAMFQHGAEGYNLEYGGQQVLDALSSVGGQPHIKVGGLWEQVTVPALGGWINDNMLRMVHVNKTNTLKIISPLELPQPDEYMKVEDIIHDDQVVGRALVDVTVTPHYASNLDVTKVMESIQGHVGGMIPELEQTQGLLIEDACVRVNASREIEWLSPDDPNLVMLHRSNYTRAQLENGTCALWDKYLSDMFCGDMVAVEYIKRWAGIALLGINIDLQAPALVLKGEPGSGKSTLVNVIASLFPGSSVSRLTLDQLNVDQSKGHSALGQLVGKRLNCNTEVNEHTVLRHHDTIKKIIFGEPASVRTIYKDSMVLKFTAAHLFAANEMPKLPSGTDTSLFKRFTTLAVKRAPVRGTSAEDRDLEAKLRAETPGILMDLIAATERALIDFNGKTVGTERGLPLLTEDQVVDMSEGDLVVRFFKQWLTVDAPLPSARQAPSSGDLLALMELFLKTQHVRADVPNKTVFGGMIKAHFAHIERARANGSRYPGIFLSEEGYEELREYALLPTHDERVSQMLRSAISEYGKMPWVKTQASLDDAGKSFTF